MHLSSFDVCVPGFERLRSQDEFILATPITAEMATGDIHNALNDDLQCCARENDFDYNRARDIIDDFCRSFNAHNPFNLEPTPPYSEDEDSCCYLFLYIEN